MVGNDVLRAHQAYYVGDRTEWRRTARLLQSLWREGQGLPPGGDAAHHGSVVGLEANPLETGCAFISDDARGAAREALKNRQRGAVIQRDRLYRNLLSSQPLCFNLFGRLSQHPQDPKTLLALQTVWPDVAAVNSITYEHSPGRGEPRFLGNGTAFDVYIEYSDSAAVRRFIGVEVKYHEDLNGQPPDIRERAIDVFRASRAFGDGADESLRKGSSAQLLLDHLLALSMYLDQEAPNGRFVLLYPERNENVESVAGAYGRHLTDVGRSTFSPLTLETVIEAWTPIFVGESWLVEFERRYLGVGGQLRW